MARFKEYLREVKAWSKGHKGCQLCKKYSRAEDFNLIAFFGLLVGTIGTTILVSHFIPIPATPINTIVMYLIWFSPVVIYFYREIKITKNFDIGEHRKENGFPKWKVTT